MNKYLVFTIIALTSIILVSAFDLQLAPVAALDVPENMLGRVLYVCPAADGFWDAVRAAFSPWSHYITIGFFFVLIVLLFSWGWALYQNLLNDSFKRDAFKNVWGYTKLTFWVGVLALIVINTPNHYRRVTVSGYTGAYVMCESNTPGAIAISADRVK